MKKVVGTFEQVSDASDAVRAIRTAGFLASDVELVVRPVDVGVADGDPASTAAGAARRIVAAGLAGGVLGGLAGLALTLMGVAIPGFETVLTAGPITAALAGAGLGALAGSAMGGITGFGVRRVHTEHAVESLRRGGALVAVHADESRVDEVESILYQQGAYLIEDRAVPRRDNPWPAGKRRFSNDEIGRGRAHGLNRSGRISARARH
jgi:hypothetical protein